MKVIGILGGVGSGKSLVAKLFEERGAVRIDADKIGHHVLTLPEVRDALRNEFGDEIFDSQGSIARPRLAKIVFADNDAGKQALKALEAITHPRITREIQSEIERLAQAGAEVLILDAPVLLKAGWKKFCDHLVFVDAPAEVRQARVMERGWTVEEWERRELAQEPLSVKREVCDLVIDNGDYVERTAEQVRQLWNGWQNLPS